MRLHLAQAEVRHEILGGAGRDPELGMTEHGPVKIIAVRDGTADAYVVIGGDLVIKDRWRPGDPNQVAVSCLIGRPPLGL